MAKKKLGEMLLEAGFVTPEQMQESLELVAKEHLRLGDVLVDKGYITAEELYHFLEYQHRVTYVDLDKVDANPSLAKHIPPEMARNHTLAPVKIENNVLYVAIEDPKNFVALDEVRMVSRMEVQPMLASTRGIQSYTERMYGNITAQRALSDLDKETTVEVVVQQDMGGESIADAPVVRLVNALLEQAVTMGASDIHIEAHTSVVRVRMRVDGKLREVMQSPINTLNGMIARIKIMSDLNIAERRIPQDGRLQVRVLERDIDVRVSILPTVHGEKAVMRLLDRSNFLKPKDKLGFTKENLKMFDDLLTTPHGIILLTGPTGSGKSTTLYTMLRELNNEHDNIITVEDPVEYMIDGLNQVQVNHKAGLDFASALRSMLRQDPDVIMIGEMRDTETVEIAIRAAITGHLVLSTIHTNDAASTVFRLVDMGVPTYMVAASLVGIIAQRLVRVICPECKENYKPTLTELDMAEITEDEAAEIVFKKGKGCTLCNEGGYKGRMAVHEIMIIDQGLRNLLHDEAPANKLKEYAIGNGMSTLKDSALRLMKDGLTTLDEVISISHGVQ